MGGEKSSGSEKSRNFRNLRDQRVPQVIYRNVEEIRNEDRASTEEKNDAHVVEFST